MKIDMHVHTNISSPCSTIEPGLMVERALELGLDAVSVTEHDDMAGARESHRVGRENGLLVLRGIEIYTDFGDMLVYGLDWDPPRWITPFEDLLERCRQAGAAIVAAHPCRVAGELERLYGRGRSEWMLDNVDAVETHNGGSSPEGNRLALELSIKHGLPGIGGSDAHFEFQVGRCFTVFEDKITCETDLSEAIRAGRCRGSGPEE